jgi:uncharacterized protein YjbI with pentapeptide repeats
MLAVIVGSPLRAHGAWPLRAQGASDAGRAVSEALQALETHSWLELDFAEGPQPCPLILLFDDSRTEPTARFATSLSYVNTETEIEAEKARIEKWVGFFGPDSTLSVYGRSEPDRAALATLRLNRGEPAPDFELLEEAILARNPEHWNLSRPEQANLERAYLVGLDLRGYDLHACNLSGANLSSSILAGCSLESSNLRSMTALLSNFCDVDMKFADLYRARFFGSHMKRAVFNHSLIQMVDFGQCDLTASRMCGSDLNVSDFTEADLTDVDFAGAHLRDAIFQQATLRGAFLKTARLEGCKFLDSDLSSANLELASLVDARVDNSILDSAEVYGASVWNLAGEPRSSRAITISDPNGSRIEVDDIRIAQFIHLIATSSNLRRIIEATTTRAVLILGRFSPDGLRAIEAIRSELRRKGLVPIVFDFESPTSRNVSETIGLLARLCRFVVADLTDARSVQHELALIAPNIRVPIAPVIRRGEPPWSMFDDLREMYHWVLPPVEFTEPVELASVLDTLVLEPVEAKVLEIRANAGGGCV